MTDKVGVLWGGVTGPWGKVKSGMWRTYSGSVRALASDFCCAWEDKLHFRYKDALPLSY